MCVYACVHAGLPYSAALVGSKLVLPGAALDGKSLYELMEAEQVRVGGSGKGRSGCY